MSASGRSTAIDYTALDEYYTQHAASLILQSESTDGQLEQPELMQIGFMHSEPCELTEVMSAEIDWWRSRIRLDDGERHLQLFRRCEPLEIPLDPGDLPSGGELTHLLICADSSGSMRFNPGTPATRSRLHSPEHDRGPYDVVLKAAYGMLQYLHHKSGVTPLKAAALNFSNQTLASGWHSADNLAAVKKVLLRYQGGGTTLDTGALRTAWQQRPDKVLATIITDGMISNAAAVCAALHPFMQSDSHVVLLHIGSPNSFTEQLRREGAEVHVIAQAGDLVDLTIGVAEQYITGANI